MARVCVLVEDDDYAQALLQGLQPTHEPLRREFTEYLGAERQRLLKEGFDAVLVGVIGGDEYQYSVSVGILVFGEGRTMDLAARHASLHITELVNIKKEVESWANRNE